jgi:hypothetical protein
VNISLKCATGKELVNLTTIYKWHDRFTSGENSTKDEIRPGPPKKIHSKIVASVWDMIKMDRRAVSRSVPKEWYSYVYIDWVRRHEKLILATLSVYFKILLAPHPF